MKVIRVLVLLCILSLLLSCRGQTETIISNQFCTAELKDRFLRSKQAEMSELGLDLAHGTALLENKNWAMAPRNERCVLTLMIDINGQKTAFTQWYIDPQAGKIYPDDDVARELVGMFAIEGTLPE